MSHIKFRMHAKSCTVQRNSDLVYLTPLEFAVLEYLVSHQGEIALRLDIEAMMAKRRRTEDVRTSNLLEVIIKNIRRKLGYHEIIVTAPKQGYAVPKSIFITNVASCDICDKNAGRRTIFVNGVETFTCNSCSLEAVL